jgi:hypothetical protein
MTENVLRIGSTIPQLRPGSNLSLTRVGRDNDGGYVIPSLVLEKSTFLFSGGYGNDYSFEKDFCLKSKISSANIYDFSITLKSLLRDLLRACGSVAVRRGHYPISYHLRNISTYLKLKSNPKISLTHKKLSNKGPDHEVEMSDLKTAFNSISTDESDYFFCKLDIEGYEYELIEELVLMESRISGLVVEFHDTFSRRDIFINSLQKLSINYLVVHTHVNNYGGIVPDGQPIVYEISLINRRMNSNSSVVPSINQSLVTQDQPNNADAPEVELIFHS